MTKERYEEGLVETKKGYGEGWMRMGYSRKFFHNGAGEYEKTRGLDNEMFELHLENLDAYTTIGVCMGEKGEVWP